MSVFVDTSALYALMVRSERGHPAVATAFNKCLDDGRALVSSNYVAVEITALLQRRIGMQAVRDFNQRILPLLSVRWISEAAHRRAAARHAAADRRGLSLVDCSSFVVMVSEGIREVLALDDDFSSQGFQVLPPEA